MSINGNGLDNRRSNLRVCTRSENNRNRGANTGSRSKFKGVNFDITRGRWRAQIYLGGRNKHLGYFNNEVDAAVAYNSAAEKFFGEYGVLNNV